MPNTVYITRRIPQAALDLLAGVTIRQWDSDDPVPHDRLEKEVAEVDGLYCLLTDRIDRALLATAPNLRIVSQMAVGVDNIDVPACTDRGIPVGHTPGILSETTADLTWALLLATARRVVEAAEVVKDGGWKTWAPMFLTGQDVYNRTLGIIGMGDIGTAVARRATGFNMRVLYHNRSPSEAANEVGAEYVDLDTLLAESDFVSLHFPLTPETEGFVDEAFLRKMKPSAILINTSRGTCVDEAALHRALTEEWIYAAGLDVTATEPIPMSSPLLDLDNCVILPHIGSASIPTRTHMATMAAENLLAGLRGEPLPNCVNCNDL